MAVHEYGSPRLDPTLYELGHLVEVRENIFGRTVGNRDKLVLEICFDFRAGVHTEAEDADDAQLFQHLK